MTETTDILIIGGGIVGMATALELQTRDPSARITLLEKEPTPAVHQSGHNSGVIHAGVYYAPGSMKARFCRDGAQATEAFCAEHDLPYDRLGKLIVATSEVEVKRMHALGQRARQNGIQIEDVDQQGLRQMEPHINGLAALYSPSTGITDFKRLTEVMATLFLSRGGVVRYGERVLSGREAASHMSVTTTKGTIQADRVVTCAGLHSDRLIRAFGQDPGYRVVPFRGEFFRLLNQPDDLVSHLIYPVPDPERPFLGVHLTRKIAGGFTVGPNAVLAFKREGYKLTDFSATDMAGTFGYPGFWRMLVQNAGSAVSELTASMSKRAYLKRIHQYCSHIQLSDLAPYPAGVRAQAVAADGKIIDDFLFVQSERCLHVGNAPSPAATSAMPIAKHIADQLQQARVAA
ncbi:L-2-hydroxyglutarate oxidase [Aliiroseovarius halocynthiae]|uniref:L-2-hydroxyglutarate oxidase n=1 Tax=Aliiroseovarius halocynthiae TaxID=985055 RepID=A0A545SU25_9RHOB|nr:L-2-hydroxyglutarate oxidase [Aliiroseovarius halocynthiae]TQV68462.1 L-2-hydroxyglutarate oxidase [Aliiroseovarius halocynthiae]SMR70859.1 L-2-hydroxyglutarate oxidase [Aliiroseovarius halocynthiae]